MQRRQCLSQQNSDHVAGGSPSYFGNGIFTDIRILPGKSRHESTRRQENDENGIILCTEMCSTRNNAVTSVPPHLPCLPCFISYPFLTTLSSIPRMHCCRQTDLPSFSSPLCHTPVLGNQPCRVSPCLQCSARQVVPRGASIFPAARGGWLLSSRFSFSISISSLTLSKDTKSLEGRTCTLWIYVH